MNRMMITAAFLLALTGCRAADPLTRTESLTGRYTYGTSHRPRTVGDATNLMAGYPAGLQSEKRVNSVSWVSTADSNPSANRLEPISLLTLDDLPPSDLTLLDFEGMALAANPVLAEMAFLVDAAEGEWLQSGLPPNPTIGYSGQQLGSHGQAEQQGVYFSQQLVMGGKLGLNRQISAWEIERAQQDLEVTRLRVLTDVRVGYYDLLIAQRRCDLAAKLATLSDQAVVTAESLFRGEEVSEADPARARVEADLARIVLETATNQRYEAWRRLTAFVGMPDLAIVRVTGQLEPEELELSWQQSLQQILAGSPEVAGAIADVEVARWGIEREQAEVVPDIEIQAVIQDDRGTGSSNGNLQISVPIPIINRNQGAIQRACAEAAAAERAIDRLALDLQTRHAAVFQRYESARNQVQQYSRSGGILENAERTLELIRAGYQVEEFGVLEMLTAQRTYFQINLAYLDSLRVLWASNMEIRGLLLSDSLQERR